MAVIAVKLLLLLLAVCQVNTQGGPTCNNYVQHPGRIIGGLTDQFMVRSFCECQIRCSSITNCNAFVWYITRCLHKYGYIMDDARADPAAILLVKVCYPSITPPPHLSTFPGTFPPVVTPPPFCPYLTTPFRPTTRRQTRQTPTTRRVFPPFFTTTSAPCPPAKGLGTGLVVLIACFSAVGGIIIGMLLAVKCCPIGHGRSWLGGSHPSSCAGTTCSPTNKSCHAQGCNGCPPPHHPMQVKPGPCMHSSNMHSGQTYAVPANTSNGIYSVNVARNY